MNYVIAGIIIALFIGLIFAIGRYNTKDDGERKDDY